MARFVSNFLLGTLSFGLITFVLIYYFRSNWRVNEVGKYVMYFMATIMVTFTYLFLFVFIDPYPGMIFVNIAILAGLNFGVWRFIWLLLRKQKEDRQRENMSDA